VDLTFGEWRGRRSSRSSPWAWLRGWPLWKLPRPLPGYLIAVQSAALLAIVVAALHTHVRARDAALFLALTGCGVALVETTRRVGQPTGGVIKDLTSAWSLPMALLLPPVYALLAPIPLMALSQWRVRAFALHRRTFGAAAIALSLGAASLIYHTQFAAIADSHRAGGERVLAFALAVAVCTMVRWAVNLALVLVPITRTNPRVRWWELVCDRDSLHSDVVEMCLGVLVTLLIALEPVLVLFAVPPVLMLQRAMLQVHLVAAARRDAKTGLLNAATWDREAADEVARTERTKEPLAVLLLDIDHFKHVNDNHGHLAGDRVLSALADTLRAYLRPYDVAGRFGGEEFSVLLPHTGQAEAERVAERLRRRVASLVVPIDDIPGTTSEVVQVTVSIGVATFGGSRVGLTELLAAADLALYRAKADGRNQVAVLADAA
jgi:diguanylate cyclase (GGDEF)-like protein